MHTLLHRLSVGLAVALAVAVSAYHWISPSWWPFAVGDFAAVLAILYGTRRASAAVLAAGWGFACGNFSRAFLVSLGTSGPSWAGVGLALPFSIALLGLGSVIVRQCVLALRSDHS